MSDEFGAWYFVWALVIVLIACLPFVVRRLIAHQKIRGIDPDQVRLISQLAIGPQQRVVVLETGPLHERTHLVLGVTAQSIQCLHSTPMRWAAELEPSPASAPATSPVKMP
jgi:flagellar protein FliO/FliZ